MHYWRHHYTVHMVYWGLEIVTMVYFRKPLLNILMLVGIYLTKQMVYFL